MYKNHFIYPYFGNKRTEAAYIIENIKDSLLKCDTIVEPYCGSSAISYHISLLYPKKFKYILNDNDKQLINLYNLVKDEKELDKLIIKLNDISKDINKEKYNLLKKDENTKLENFLYIRMIYQIRPNLFPTEKEQKRIKKDFSYIKDLPIIKFLKNEDVEIYNNDGIDILEKYNNNEKNLIILDPPYLMSDNLSYYSDIKRKRNIYEYLFNNDIKKMNASIILILEKIWIIELLFNNCINDEYEKKYFNQNKRKTKHIIIKNK